MLCGALALLGLAALAIVSVAGWTVIRTDYGSGIVCVVTMGLFLLCKTALEGRLSGPKLAGVSMLTWGIYLVHPLFLNILLKCLRWNPMDHFPAVSMPLLVAVVFAISGAIIYLVRKIPFVKKYFL